MTASATTKKNSKKLPRGPYAISAEAIAADQRRRLLEALPIAVAKSGFEATTVERIVKLAKVRRKSFYEQFEDKADCFAAAYEIAQERLLGVATYQCYTRAGLADRVGSALSAALELLRDEPVLGRLIFVEAPAAGEAIAVRHHHWLDRYGRLLAFAAIDGADAAPPKVSIEPAIVGGVVSRVKQLVLAGETARLPTLGPELVQFVLSFYGMPDASPSSEDASSQPQSPEHDPVLEPA